MSDDKEIKEKEGTEKNGSEKEEKASETSVKSAKAKSKRKKIKILFVCTGNTCRSAMASYIFVAEAKKMRKASKFSVASAGLEAEVGGDMNERAKNALTKRGVAYGKHKPRQLDVQTVEKTDYVICMTSYHKYAIEAVTGERKNLFTADDFDGCGDVADPYGGDDEVYSIVADRLIHLCNAVIYKLFPPKPEKILSYMP